MRILRIIATMDPASGGPCEGIRNSVPAQKSKGVENEIISFDAPDAAFLKNEKVQIHALGPAKGPYSYCPKLQQWLFDNLDSFDVAIIHGLWLYNSYGTFRVWNKMRKLKLKTPKLYLMPHGMLDPYFQKDKSRRLKAIRNWLFWKIVENRVVNGVDGMLFTCEQELLLARKTFKPYHPKLELNIGYGIHLPPLSNSKFNRAFFENCPELKFRPYWLFLSRIHPKKGVDNLILAYLRLKKLNPHLPALVVAGPGLESSFGSQLKEMAQDAKIYFPGMLSGPSKWGAFYNCEAFVLPSHQENFGIAVVEAMACAKPVLISNQINIWKEIEIAGAGLICEDTEDGIFNMLNYWAKESKEQKTEMGKRAFLLFKKRFAVEEAALRMIEGVS